MVLYISTKISSQIIKVILLLLPVLLTLCQRYQAFKIISIPLSSIMRYCISLELQKTIYNLRQIRKMMRYYLLIKSINRIDIYIVSIEIHSYL